MNKLIATLILGLALSGAALADDGYFADHQGDFSNAPVSAAKPYDGEPRDWSYREIPVPTSNSAGIANSDESMVWFERAS